MEWKSKVPHIVMPIVIGICATAIFAGFINWEARKLDEAEAVRRAAAHAAPASTASVDSLATTTPSMLGSVMYNSGGLVDVRDIPAPKTPIPRITAYSSAPEAGRTTVIACCPVGWESYSDQGVAEPQFAGEQLNWILSVKCRRPRPMKASGGWKSGPCSTLVSDFVDRPKVTAPEFNWRFAPEGVDWSSRSIIKSGVNPFGFEFEPCAPEFLFEKSTGKCSYRLSLQNFPRVDCIQSVEQGDGSSVQQKIRCTYDPASPAMTFPSAPPPPSHDPPEMVCQPNQKECAVWSR